MPTAVVRMLGRFHTLRRNRGLETEVAAPVPEQGLTGAELARCLDLPLEFIEAVFVNHTARDLGHRIHPGDQVAFVPTGTPGPHRFTLGIYHAGAEKEGGS